MITPGWNTDPSSGKETVLLRTHNDVVISLKHLRSGQFTQSAHPSDPTILIQLEQNGQMRGIKKAGLCVFLREVAQICPKISIVVGPLNSTASFS